MERWNMGMMEWWGRDGMPALGGARVCVPWTSRRSSLPKVPSSNLSAVGIAKADIPRFHHSSIPIFNVEALC
jgi:hypothetical protein